MAPDDVSPPAGKSPEGTPRRHPALPHPIDVPSGARSELEFVSANMLEFVSLHDSASVFLYASPSVERILGFSPGELVGTYFCTLFHPDDIGRMERERERQSPDRRSPTRMPFRARRKDNTYIWLDMLCEHLLNDAGESDRCIAVCRWLDKANPEIALQRSGTLESAILNNASYIVITTDAEGVIQTFNPAAERLLGYAAVEMLGAESLVVVHNPRELERLSQDLADEDNEPLPPNFSVLSALAKRRVHDDTNWTYVRKNGSRFPVSLSLTAIANSSGEFQGCLAIASDITDRRSMESALRDSEQLFRSAVDAMQEGIMLFDRDYRILFCNSRAEEILGLSSDIILERTALDPRWRLVTDDGSYMATESIPIDITLRTGKPQRNKVIGIHRPDGRLIWLEMNSSPLYHAGESAPYAAVATFGDITESREVQQQLREYTQALIEQKQDLERANAQLEGLATVDAMTGLKNYRVFQERLEDEFQRARRYSIPLSVVIADVDRFKDYNDQFGHLAGDDVLTSIAGMLLQGARSSDLVARYGGEEFVIILPHTPGGEARRIAERVRAAIEYHPWRMRGLTTSFGVASLDDTMRDRADLVDRADKALFLSKKHGRNRVTMDELAPEE